MGSDGSAAGGGRSDQSEWQRSARDEGRKAEDIRWAPQQDTGTIKNTAVGAMSTAVFFCSIDLSRDCLFCKEYNQCLHYRILPIATGSRLEEYARRSQTLIAVPAQFQFAFAVKFVYNLYFFSVLLVDLS